IVEPRTVDLAAAVFRGRLFGEAGFTIWNNTWYAGHPTWSNSVLVPPLSWLLSPALLAAISAVVSAALFEPLARRHFGPRAARWGALWFGAAAATPMLSGRVTFAAGGALAGGPLLLMARGRRLGLPVVALLVAFGVWQWSAAVRDLAQTAGDRSTQASFYRPLNDFLGRAGGAPFRVEIPFTFSHWETAEVAPRFALARGWLRPDDVEYNHLFYGGTLSAATYRAWLADHGVRFVAVPHAKPDYSARAELRLIASRPPYLRPVWSSSDWRVYEVTPAASIGVTRLGGNDADVRVGPAGSAVARVRWSPYWAAK